VTGGEESEWSVDQWTDFERVGQILAGQKWVFARTMAYNPHWYTLRRTWAQPDDEFTLAIEVIRDLGYPQRFGKRDWTCLDLNDHFH